jgi:hypothetical protein
MRSVGEFCWFGRMGIRLVEGSCWFARMGARLVGGTCWFARMGARLVGGTCRFERWRCAATVRVKYGCRHNGGTAKMQWV